MSAAQAPQELPELAPWPATWRGIVTALVLVVPAGVLNHVLIDNETIEPTSPVTFLLWLTILLGGAAGGWATIRLSPDAPLRYPAVAAASAYLIVQAVGVVRRLAADEPVSWLAYPFLALFMATCGMLGGMFARGWLRG